MDKKRIEKAVKEILSAVGEDVSRSDIKDTPKRVADMYEEILSGINANPEKELEVVFEKDHDEIVLLKNIPLYSMCECGHAGAAHHSTGQCFGQPCRCEKFKSTKGSVG